jgi:hypothetical protein
MPDFPFVTEFPNVDWNNYHGSLPTRRVASFLTLERELDGPPEMKQHGAALKAILGHCFQNEARLTIQGSKWSLSNTLDPGSVILDPGQVNLVEKIPDAWQTDAYKGARGNKRLFIAGGGATIRRINDVLGRKGFALQTSGAADGHRVAGCIGTGTHGADIKVGAVHDTVVAVVLMVEPNRMVVVQADSGPLDDKLGDWLKTSTDIHTETVRKDEVLHAAQVALGGLGFVYAVVLEVAPLYEIGGMEYAEQLFDNKVWQVVEHLDSSGLGGPEDPDILAIMTFPYARQGDPKGSVTSVYKKLPTQRVYSAPTHATPMIATDTSKLITFLGHFDGGLGGEIIRGVVTGRAQGAFPNPGPVKPHFPGELFGPTTLPEGNGTSTEIVIRRQDAGHGLRILLDTLRSEGREGRHHFGVAGVRFVAGSRAHLAMNQGAGTMFVEVAGLKTPHSQQVFRACWSALRNAGVHFACHWGQEYGLNPAQVAAYYGAGVGKWKQARSTLLNATGKKVFTTPLLQQLDLD